MFLWGVFWRILYINDPLWLDEFPPAALTVRPWLEMFAVNRGFVPELFLSLVRIAASIGGCANYSWQIVPLLFGISVIPLAYFALRYLKDEDGAIVAIALFSANQHFIYYSHELKPYSADLFFAVALMFAGEAALRERSRRVVWRLLAVTAFALLLSHTSSFVSAFVWCRLAWMCFRAPAATRNFAPYLAMLPIALAIKHARVTALTHNHWLMNYWATGFHSPTPKGLMTLGWEAWRLWTLFLSSSTLLVVLLSIALTASFFGRYRTSCWYLLGVSALTVIASFLKLYPISEPRLMMHVYAFAMLSAASGIAQMFVWVGRKPNVYRIGLQLTCVSLVLMAGLSNKLNKSNLMNVPKFAREFANHVRPQDSVFVDGPFHAMRPLYFPMVKKPFTALPWVNPSTSFQKEVDARLNYKHSRVWHMSVVGSMGYGTALATRCEKKDKVVEGQVEATLYQCSKNSSELKRTTKRAPHPESIPAAPKHRT